jgi:transposase
VTDPAEISGSVRQLVTDICLDRQVLDSRIEAVNAEFVAVARHDDAARRRLVTIPGVGVLNATALVAAVGDGAAFRRGRDLGAWLGLVPKQHTTGGRPKLLGISKRGNKYLRMLFIHERRWSRNPPSPRPPRSGWSGTSVGRAASIIRRTRRSALCWMGCAARPASLSSGVRLLLEETRDMNNVEHG